VQALEYRLKWLSGALFLVAALAVVWPLVTRVLVPSGGSESNPQPAIDSREPSIPASLRMPNRSSTATQPATQPTNQPLD
jgi:hypothetical protein